MTSTPGDTGSAKPANKGPGLVKLARAWIRRAVFDNAAIKFVSLVLSVTLFILVNTGQDVTIWLDVVVQYSTPEDRVLVSEPVDKVTIGIRGSWRRTRRFDERELERINVDLRDRDNGLFEFQPHLFRLPQGLELVSISPRTMRVDFEPLASNSVPVQVEVVGQPEGGYRLAKATPTPATVTIRGARSRVDAVNRVETIAVGLDGRTENFTERVPLAIPTGVTLDGATNVSVEIELVEALERRVVEDVPVVIRSGDTQMSADARFSVEPATVDIVLVGAQAAIDAAMSEQLFPYVTVAPDEPGGRTLPVLLSASGVGHELRPSEVTLVKK